MASVIRFFMAPEDEVAFFHFLSRHHLEVYPQRIRPDWQPFLATTETLAQVPQDGAYLTSSRFGRIQVDKVKRGPNKGDWRVDEVRSPVIYFERSQSNESSELVAGRLWAELEVTPQTGRRDAAPEYFRQLFREISEWFRKNFRRSQPAGFMIGPIAARLSKKGLVLRGSDPKGPLVKPYR